MVKIKISQIIVDVCMIIHYISPTKYQNTTRAATEYTAVKYCISSVSKLHYNSINLLFVKTHFMYIELLCFESLAFTFWLSPVVFFIVLVSFQPLTGIFQFL